MDRRSDARLRAITSMRDDDLQTLAEEVRLRYQALGAMYLREAERLGKALRRPGPASRLAGEVRRAIIFLEPWDQSVTPRSRNPD